eukprot:s6748_g5.t1
MQCYKQVFLPNASLDEGDTAHGDTRPISIGCVLNRVVSGAMLLHPSCQRWIQGLVPGQMHGALKGRNLEAGIVNLLEQWRHSDSVLLSLDLRKGFDYADANHSLKVLEHYGFCDEWLRYLTGVWERQLRFSQIEPYVTSVPEVVRRSLPQGDPLAPLAFCLLLVPAGKATTLPRPSLWTTATEELSLLSKPNGWDGAATWGSTRTPGRLRLWQNTYGTRSTSWSTPSRTGFASKRGRGKTEDVFFLEVSGWVQAWAPASCHGAIPGRDIFTALAVLEERVQGDWAVLASLDLQKAFDNCSPGATVRMLTHLGLPGGLVCWLQQGAPGVHGSFFLDDRNLAGTDAHGVLDAVAFAEHWSQRLGLQENYTKLSVVARSLGGGREQKPNPPACWALTLALAATKPIVRRLG